MPYGPPRVEVPEPYWLAHPHWVWEAEAEGRGEWVPASISELPPDLAERVRQEIEYVREHFGAERRPRLWKRVK